MTRQCHGPLDRIEIVLCMQDRKRRAIFGSPGGTRHGVDPLFFSDSAVESLVPALLAPGIKAYRV